MRLVSLIFIPFAQALGHLARAGGSLTADFVEFEVKRALEWLQGDRSEQRRHAAVLVLKELAENAPTLFNVHVSPVFICALCLRVSFTHIALLLSAYGFAVVCLF